MTLNTAVVTKTLYGIGEAVPASGLYVCVPCGYVMMFESGSEFVICPACFAGTELGPLGYQDASAEFWQFLG